MSVSESNLSDPRYGFDLVVAVTQASVNATLKQLLAGLAAPEVVLCYVYDANGDLVPIDYQTLVTEAKGADPFTIPPDADPKDPRLVNLAALGFVGAVKARLGLPDMPLADLPPIVTFGAGAGAPVRFNLLCAEFQIVGIEYIGPTHMKWTNTSQPSGSGTPWYFSANVSLDITTIDPNSRVPPAVQQRIIDLQHAAPNAFTIQKLFLDLDTAILETVPQIEGLSSGSVLWNMISAVFLGAYFTQLKQSGDPVLSYSFTVTAPRSATLQLGAVSREVSPLLQNGHPISNPTPAQSNAAALVYVGSQSTTAPTPVPFAWNWVELNEVDAFSGVQAVRRDVFAAYLAQLVNAEVGALCLDTNVHLSHSGESFTIKYSTAPASAPRGFAPISLVGLPSPDGFNDLLSLDFACPPSHDSSTSASHAVRIWGNYDYALTGRVGVRGNQIRIWVEAVASMSFKHTEGLASFIDLPYAPYYDKKLTVLYTLGVDQNGVLQVTQTNGTVSHAKAWDFHPRGLVGLLGLEGHLKAGLTSVEDSLAAYIDRAFTRYVDDLTATINGYRAWVFPGNEAFTFKDLYFSDGHDLTARLTYVNPN